MAKRSANTLDFFLSKQTMVENETLSENELEISMNTTEDISLDHSDQDISTSINIEPSIPHPHHLDIGLFVSENQLVNEELRLEILLNCWTPPGNYTYPPITDGSRKRYFNGSWLTLFPWLAYSEYLSGAFCKICVMFLDRNNKQVGKGGMQKVGSLVISPFTNYKKAINTFNTHSQLAYHKDCCVKSETFKRMTETYGLDIRDQLNQQRMQQKQTNRDRLVPIIETILFLGRQELAFRGHRGESAKLNIAEPNENDGNFRAALRLRLRAGDSVLKEHLMSSGANAKYLSPKIQNEIINICGSMIIEKIVSEVHESVPFLF